jgi:hypothetical protein
MDFVICFVLFKNRIRDVEVFWCVVFSKYIDPLCIVLSVIWPHGLLLAGCYLADALPVLLRYMGVASLVYTQS